MQQENNKPEITICSIYHSPQSRKFLEMNERFARERNPEVSWVWIVADNLLDGGKRLDPKLFQTISGVRQDDVVSRLPLVLKESRNARISYHHAEAVAKLLPQVTTRFMVLLDNDLFIVRKHWIREVLAYMRTNDLGFFGISWHPKWWNKYRYFPDPHALFIDLEQVKKSDLNFFPQFERDAWKDRLQQFSHTYFPGFLARMVGRALRRTTITNFKDTAHHIYEKFRNGPVKYDYAIAAFAAPMQTSFLKKLTRVLLPDRWQYGPKRKGYYTTTHFRDLGFFDVTRYGGEEFFWKGAPFCFHMRRFKRSGVPLEPEDEIKILETALASFRA